MKKTASKNNASFIKAQEKMIGQSKATFFLLLYYNRILSFALKR